MSFAPFHPLDGAQGDSISRYNLLKYQHCIQYVTRGGRGYYSQQHRPNGDDQSIIVTVRLRTTDQTPGDDRPSLMFSS